MRDIGFVRGSICARPSFLASSMIGSAYNLGGRWKEAEGLEAGVTEIMKRVLGEEHPDTLTSMNNLPFTNEVQGQIAEAVKLMQECIRLRSRALGANYSDKISYSTAHTKSQIIQHSQNVRGKIAYKSDEMTQVDLHRYTWNCLQINEIIF